MFIVPTPHALHVLVRVVYSTLCRTQAKKELLEKHYAEHKGKPFYDSLIQYMLTGPTLAAVRAFPFLSLSFSSTL